MAIKIGIIGGTGMNSQKSFEYRETRSVTTVFGNPASELLIGNIKGVECVILSRHGHNHNIMPSNINYRANILALKEAGCTHIIATTACGSLNKNVKPGEFVIVDQFIDRTVKRPVTFYDGTQEQFKGVCHIPMRNPFSKSLRDILAKSCVKNSIPFHKEGTMITIEGPRFSSLAESRLFQSWGASVINMTTVPEVVLANELGVPYCSLALVTDYDCWKEDEHVSVEAVLKTMVRNAENAVQVIICAVELTAAADWKGELEEALNVASNAVMKH